jgi:tetratricopeptide (TPR) repeat protein
MQKIRVAAVNLSLSKLPWREQVLLGTKISNNIKSFTMLRVLGADATQYLQGQTTQDVKSQKLNQAFINTVLDGSGHLIAAFSQVERINHLGNREWIIIVEENLQKILFDRLSLYIISEDVELELAQGPGDSYHLYLGIFPIHQEISQEDMPVNYLGLPGIFSNRDLPYPNLSAQDIHNFETLQGKYQGEFSSRELFTNTIYSEMALSLTKGCFLGQETVAKIVSRRGASFYPTLLQVDLDIDFNFEAIFQYESQTLKVAASAKDSAQNYLLALLPRELRIPKLSMKIDVSGNKVESLGVIAIPAPLIPVNLKSLSLEIYHALLSLSSLSVESKNFAAEGLSFFCETYPDSPCIHDGLEMRGVMLSQMKRFPEAIACFEILNQKDPLSIMACVNLSRIYGEMQEIQKAEDYKAEGIVRSFYANAASAAPISPAPAAAHDPTKIQMFLDVLEIDPEDKFARFQLAQIYSDQKEWGKLEKLITGEDFKQLIHTDPEFARPIFELKKYYYQDPLADQALRLGIEAAAKLGKQKVLQELQLLLSN